MKLLFPLLLAALCLVAGGPSGAQATKYEAKWASLDTRPNPAWYDDAKFGIFIHWGLYAVPAWGPKGQYAEWYWNAMSDRNSATWKFHAKTYGENFRYQDFVPGFRAELFEPDQWADLFARSGARYVVLTSKHHDGFCLWPSAQSWNWNSVDVGPHRDLAGDLAKAVRAKGLRMGYYYSLYEWFNPLYKADPKRYVDEHMLPQIKDLVTRYQPSLIFSDGEWDHPSETWRSAEFLQWLYNDSPVKDEVIVNDRWGKETRSQHGSYFTTEYGEVGGGKKLAAGRKWEENRGMGASYGYNRNETLADYKTGKQLIHILADMVSKGGNLLLNVGPTADGRIPVVMQERLEEIGRWLGVNGEAIYGTKPWKTPVEGKNIRYTAKGDAVYAICLEWPGREFTLDAPTAGGEVSATLLGLAKPVRARRADGKLRIEVPAFGPDELGTQPAYVFKLTGVK
jgi:alpha-L-fucosidase